MNVAASGRTWEDASSPAALRLTRRYEEAWQEADRTGTRLDPGDFLSEQGESGELPGSWLAILRSDLGLRWEAGDRVSARWYLDRFPKLGEEARVALVYEEFCLREEGGEEIDPASFLTRYQSLAAPLRRVLDIHRLVGSAGSSTSPLFPQGSVSPATTSQAVRVPFPEAGETIGGFYLVEELGRGAFARVFLARERQLADRFVALKVTRKGSREPQALARLQHTHIVPVHSHRVDPATRLHLLCMPYFGRVTLARVLAEVRLEGEPLTGAALSEALDRLGEPAEGSSVARSACRVALTGRSYAQAIAWWGARLAEALEHAHDRGVLHRDIKPSNVLVIDDGMPMLLDFNLAREWVLDEDEPAEATLGGTVDYMAPEHLEALAEGLSDQVDRRADIYGLGVLLYEAVVGKKPFLPPRKGHSVVDSLFRAADDRRRDWAEILPADLGIPAPLAAVIRRCLEPEPGDRYQTAAELAADLRAVADDLPLIHAREPLISRMGRRLRRNRRRLATALIVLMAGAAVLGAYVNFQFERYERFSEVKALYMEGSAAIDKREFKEAQIWLNNAAKRANHPELASLRNIVKWRTVWDFGDRLRQKLELLWTNPPMEELEDNIRIKARIAGLIVTAEEQADSLLGRSETLRFQLIGLGGNLPDAVKELKDLLKPFYVLNSKDDWDRLEHIWGMLGEDRRKDLRHEVNELLFLWMVGIETALRSQGESPRPAVVDRDPMALKKAIDVCDRALTFAEAKGPWLALRRLLEEQRGRGSRNGGGASGARQGIDDPPATLLDEPIHISQERSPVACFQWGLLCSSQGRVRDSIAWLDQAALLDSANYWYQFYLAYLEDGAGLQDDALDHYSAAVARQPDSPWVRINRARLYRAKGRWTWALEDLKNARDAMGNHPEVLRVALEIGVVHASLGDFSQAAAEYRKIIAAAPESEYARAATLNLANIDAESGREEQARVAYETLLKGHPDDLSARESRAYLNLRLGQPRLALNDLDVLLQHQADHEKQGELRSARAIALLLLRQNEESVADAAEARRLWPRPSSARLWQRALLAAGRYDELELDRPDEVLLLPVAGAWLRADLRAAARELARQPKDANPPSYRALLNRAVILSALGKHAAALEASDRALEIAGLSPQVHLIRARILHHAGDGQRAMKEVEEGRRLQPNEPGLLELLSVLLTESGHPDQALAYLDQAITRAPHHFAHVHKAAALVAMGRNEEALYEWSIALKRDPELPRAYLGRAQCYVRLHIWDRALADLEQAAAWAHGDFRLQIGVMLTYAKCLLERPDHLGRCMLLLERTARQGWELLTRATVSTGFFIDRQR